MEFERFLKTMTAVYFIAITIYEIMWGVLQ